MNALLRLARPEILQLEAYQAAAWEPALERLHANENPWRSPGDNSIEGLNRYPEPYPAGLTLRLAALYEVEPERLLAGRGSDEGIDLLVRAFCRAGSDSVLILPPTFGMYEVAARVQGARVDRWVLTPQQSFTPTVDGIVAACRPDTKLVFLCSPNNPTGNDLAPETVLAVASALDGEALIVVDEAYVEFAGRASFAERQRDFPNLVVLRTLSKAHALAGARCGCVIADPAVIGVLKRIVPPYAIASSTIEAVVQALQPAQLAISRSRVATLIAERKRLAAELRRKECVVRVYPSAANFLLVQFRDANLAFERTRSAGLLVRSVRNQPGLAACLRITVGLPEQNSRLLRALEAA